MADNSFSANQSTKGSFNKRNIDLVWRPPKSQQPREDWDRLYDKELFHRKRNFIDKWGDQIIPQDAIDDFIHYEEAMKSRYDKWVEDQLQRHASDVFTDIESDSGEGVVLSPTFGEGLIPSDLFTPKRNSSQGNHLAPTISQLGKTISDLKYENNMLNEHVRTLHQQSEASLAAEPVINQLKGQLASIQEQVSALKASQNTLSQSQSDLKESLTSDALKNDMELCNFTFTAKCALLEKILGVDITTTGPKPGNLLELLHNRLWHLESTLLPPHAPYYHGNQTYQCLSEFVKPRSSAIHRTVNYSAAPGQKAPGQKGHRFPFVINSAPSQQPNPTLNGHNHGNNSHAGMGPTPQQPSFPIPKPKFESQDVRNHAQPRAKHQKVQTPGHHPLQNDPSIPKGPKSKTPDPQAASFRAVSVEWPALGSNQIRPKSSNSLASTNGNEQQNQGASNVFEEDKTSRHRAVPYYNTSEFLQPGQHAQGTHLTVPQTPTPQHSRPTQSQQTPQHPKPQKTGGSMNAFLQVPGGFDAAPAKKKCMCDGKNCDYC